MIPYFRKKIKPTSPNLAYFGFRRVQTMKIGLKKLELPLWAAGVILVMYAGIIFIISSLPHPTQDYQLPTGGIPHFIEYAGLGLLAGIYTLLWHQSNRRICFWPWSFAWVGAALYAASDELHQMFVPCRSAELTDWLIDLAGISCMLVLLRFLIFRKIVQIRLLKER